MNSPEPLPSSTETESSPSSAATMSWSPSPLNSPSATDCGSLPKSTGWSWGPNPPFPLPSIQPTLS